MAEALYKRQGGHSGLDPMVGELYRRLRESDRLVGFFDGFSDKRMRDHQTKFVSALFGGPAVLPDKTLSRLHGHLGIDADAFDEMKAQLDLVMAEAGLGDADRAEAREALERCRPHIVAPANETLVVPDDTR